MTCYDGYGYGFEFGWLGKGDHELRREGTARMDFVM